MRLIDADELVADIENSWDWLSINNITASTVLRQTIADIKAQPTVKALSNEDIQAVIRAILDDTVPKRAVDQMLKEIEDHLQNVQYCLEHMPEPDTMRPKLLGAEDALIDVLNTIHYWTDKKINKEKKDESDISGHVWPDKRESKEEQ